MDPARKPFRSNKPLSEADREHLRDRAREGDLDACSALARNAVNVARRLPKRR